MLRKSGSRIAALAVVGALALSALIVAIILGGFVTFVGLRSWFVLALLMGALSFAVAFSWVVVSAMQAKRWALITFLAMVTFLVDASARSQGYEGPTFDLQSLVKLMVWAGAMAIGLAHLARSVHVLATLRGAAVLAYGLWALISTVYSVSPGYTAGAGFAFLSFVLFSAALVCLLDQETILKTIAATLFVFLVVSVGWYLLGPGAESSLLGERRAIGISGSPNNLGRISTLFILILLLLVGERVTSKRLAFATSGVGVIALLLSQSRTSFLALAAGFIASRRGRQRWYIVLVAVVGIAVLALAAQSIPYFSDYVAKYVSRSGGTSEVFTLTGRTKIWSYVWDKWLQSPWLGFGYASTKTFMVEEFFTSWWWTTQSAHNSILQSLVTVGLLGTSFVILTWLAQLHQMLVHPNSFRDAIFAFVFVTGLTEAGAVGNTPSLLTLLWLIGVMWLPSGASDTVMSVSKKQRALVHLHGRRAA